MEQPQRVNVIVVGFGRIGQTHFENLMGSSKFTVVGVVDPIIEIRNKFGDRARCKTYAELREALADDKTLKIDGVLICSPTAFHVEHIKASLNAGKAVFCEKPISNDLKAIDEVFNFAKEKKIPLLCGFQRRSDMSFVKLQQKLANGSIGKLVKVKTISRDHPFPNYAFLRTSGGIVFDCCSHDVDVQCWLAGEAPDLVYCIGTAIDPEVKAMNDYDTLEVLFHFPNGAVGSIDISRHSRSGYDQRIEVLGTEGSIIAENPKDTTVIIGSSNGFITDPSIYSFPTRYKQAYITEVEHFADLITGEAKTPRLTHHDVRINCIILHAIAESASTGQPVKIKYTDSKL